MWIIANDKGEILAHSKKRIVDTRAFEITDEDFKNHKLADDIVWVMRDENGAINQASDQYPLHELAQAISRKDREFVDYVAACKAEAETRDKRRAAKRRVIERLIDEELAKPDQLV